MLLGNNPFANIRTLPSVIGFWAVGEDFFPNSEIFLLGKSLFANSSGLGCWESVGLLAKPQFPVVKAHKRASARLFFLKIWYSRGAWNLLGREDTATEVTAVKRQLVTTCGARLPPQPFRLRGFDRKS
jgi:hypothetical protein